MQNIGETFGSTNIKWIFVWNIFFAVYVVAIKNHMLSVIIMLIAFAVVGTTAIRFIQKKKTKNAEEEESTNYFSDFEEGLTELIHTTVNAVLNWLTRIFSHLDIIEIGFGLMALKIVEKFCFYADDLIIIYALGNFLILFKGIKEIVKPYAEGLLELKDTIRSQVSSLLSRSPKTQ